MEFCYEVENFHAYCLHNTIDQDSRRGGVSPGCNATYQERHCHFGASESSVYDGSWVRLRELTLSYDFKLKSSVPVIRSLNVYATGRNLWLSTDYPGVDPETSLTGSGSNVNGFDYFNNPGTKSYIFGVKVGF